MTLDIVTMPLRVLLQLLAILEYEIDCVCLVCPLAADPIVVMPAIKWADCILGYITGHTTSPFF